MSPCQVDKFIVAGLSFSSAKSYVMFDFANKAGNDFEILISLIHIDPVDTETFLRSKRQSSRRCRRVGSGGPLLILRKCPYQLLI